MSLPGLSHRLAAGSIPVLRIHYSADPAKRPGTAAGDAWLDEAPRGYPGGRQSPRWRKEQEIDYGAMGGTRLFPNWEAWVGRGQIVIDPFRPTGYRLYGSYDHGWRNPAAFHVHGINGDGAVVTLWEFYAAHVPVSAVAQIILGHEGAPVILPDGRRFAPNPFAGELTWMVADPSIWADDQPMADETNKSIADLFRRCGVVFVPGERGGDTMVAEWLHGHYWQDPDRPLYRITTDCPKLLWELGQLRHREFSPRVALAREQSEKLVDKDDHAWDGLKMFLRRFPPRPVEARAAATPATFLWWRAQAKRAKDGQPVRTFRREMVG
ncbi:MAG: hypothetical protein HY323_09085 [Betaproteobacteria bacterium]|nr:hypothetical protein [Betaproteobacteria bacterium]